MKYIVLETNQKDCVVLDEAGRFIKAVNKNYEVGETIGAIEEILVKPTRAFNLKRTAAVAASLAACFVLVLALQFFNNAEETQEPFASVLLAMNPEIKIDICEEKRVVDIAPLDDDGRALLEGYAGEQDDFFAVAGDLVNYAVAVGFLKDGGRVTITITSPNELDEAWLEEMKACITQTINEILAGRISIAVEIRKNVGQSGLIMMGEFIVERTPTREPVPPIRENESEQEQIDEPPLQEARVPILQQARPPVSQLETPADTVDIIDVDIPGAEYEPITEPEGEGEAEYPYEYTQETLQEITPEAPPMHTPDRRPSGGGGGGGTPPLECGCRNVCTCELECGCIAVCTCELECGCIAVCTCELECGCIGTCTCPLECGCIGTCACELECGCVGTCICEPGCTCVGNCTCELECGCIGTCTCIQGGIPAHNNQIPITRDGEIFRNIYIISTEDTGLGDFVSPNSVVEVWYGGSQIGIITLGNPNSDAVVVLFDTFENYDITLNIRWQSGSFYAEAVLNQAGVYVIPRLWTPGEPDGNAMNQFNGMWWTTGRVRVEPRNGLMEVLDFTDYLDYLNDYLEYLDIYTYYLNNCVSYYYLNNYVSQ